MLTQTISPHLSASQPTRLWINTVSSFVVGLPGFSLYRELIRLFVVPCLQPPSMASIEDLPEVRPNSQSSQPDDHPNITPREGDQSPAWNGMSIHSCAHCQKVEIDIRHRRRWLKQLYQFDLTRLSAGKLAVTYSEVRTAVEDGCTLFERLFPQPGNWWDNVVNQGLQEHRVTYELHRFNTTKIWPKYGIPTFVYASEGMYLCVQLC